MKKKPHLVLKEIAKEAYEREIKSLHFFFEHLDKLITWSIRFAVGSITLISANFKSLIGAVPNNIRLIILLLSCTRVREISASVRPAIKKKPCANFGENSIASKFDVFVFWLKSTHFTTTA